MALSDLLSISGESHKIGLSEERIEAIIPIARQYIGYWRDYPDMFVDFLAKNCGSTFKFYFYQRVFMRVAARHKYVYATYPRAYSKSFLSMMLMMVRCILYPGAKLFVTSGGKERELALHYCKIVKNKFFELLEYPKALLPQYN